MMFASLFKIIKYYCEKLNTILLKPPGWLRGKHGKKKVLINTLRKQLRSLQLLPAVLPGNALKWNEPPYFLKRPNHGARNRTSNTLEAYCGVYRRYRLCFRRITSPLNLLKLQIMDKMKESIGLERQINVIIKRYVKELLCYVVCTFRQERRPLAKQHCRLAGKTRINKLAIAGDSSLIPRTTIFQPTFPVV